MGAAAVVVAAARRGRGGRRRGGGLAAPGGGRPGGLFPLPGPADRQRDHRGRRGLLGFLGSLLAALAGAAGQVAEIGLLRVLFLLGRGLGDPVDVDDLELVQAEGLVKKVLVVGLLVIVVLVGFDVVVQVLLDGVHDLHIQHVVVDEPHDPLQLREVELVHGQEVVALLDEVLVGFLAAAGAQPLDLQVAFLRHLRQLLDDLRDPLAGGLLGFLLRRQLFRLRQSLLGVGLRFRFLLAVLEGLHLGFDEFSGVDQRILVLDVARTDPGFDLVAQPLELLDFLFQIHLVFLLLVLLFRGVDLLPDLVEELDTLVDLFHDPIDLGCGSIRKRAQMHRCIDI